jgi:hypothetical protein
VAEQTTLAAGMANDALSAATRDRTTPPADTGRRRERMHTGDNGLGISWIVFIISVQTSNRWVM